MSLAATLPERPFATEEVRFAAGPHLLYGQLRLVDRAAPALLLMHGLGFHSFEYEELAPRLARAGFNALAFDFRGHGRSAGPRGRWVLQDLVDDAQAALAYLASRVGGRIGAFGNSLGAIVGVALAAREPRVESLVASGCPTRVADFAVTPARRALLATLQAVAAVIPSLRVSANHFIPYRRILRRPEVIARVRADALIADARRLAPATYADMFTWNALPAAARLNVPLLVLYAEHDGLQPPAVSKLLFDAAPGRKTMRGIDAGHVPNLEVPEAVAAILIDWFGHTLNNVTSATGLAQ